ncbi:MAG: Mut7-C RNAse domain-containing protein [Thermoplasmata archaeon]
MLSKSEKPADDPRWLADEMVGRLARYLRFLGYDTVYVRGADDHAIAERTQHEGRILVTRDRALAARVPDAILIASPELAEQLKTVQRAFPALRTQVRFERCTRCNGQLRPAAPTDLSLSDVPDAIRTSGVTIYRCGECGHLYWEGSHTAEIRRRMTEWFGSTST